MAAHTRPPPSDIIDSEEILQYIHPSLLEADYNDRRVKGIIISSTFVIFTGVLFLCLLFFNIFSAFRSLPLKIKVFMALSVSRGVYGTFGIVIGTYALLKTTNLDRDVVYGTNATSSVAMFITVGFFIFELSAVIVSDIMFKSFSKMLITHHGLALTAYVIAIYLRANFCFGCKGLLLEMSTPFSCLSYVLLKAGMERSVFWKANQLILIHTFHLRSLLECHLWYVSYYNWQHITSNMPTVIFFLLYANLVAITFIMTPYWGYKKTQQYFNPVDWNFQESRNTDYLSSDVVRLSNRNGAGHTNGDAKKMI